MKSSVFSQVKLLAMTVVRLALPVVQKYSSSFVNIGGTPCVNYMHAILGHLLVGMDECCVNVTIDCY